MCAKFGGFTAARTGLLALDARANLGRECARLDRAWERFVRGKDEGDDVRDVIRQSWYRCVDHQLDPFNNRSALSLSEAQVREHVDTDPLMEEVKPVLASLTDTAFDSDHLLVFCDAVGNILSIDGEASVQRKADSMNFVVGSIWNERNAGTNAIGTALATGSPVQVFASEHYCHEVHPWTCSASPVLDPATHRVLGAVNLTGLREVFHPHTLAVVIAATQLIEQRLRGKLELDRFHLLEHYIAETLRRPNVALAVLDRGLRVVKACPTLVQHGWFDGEGRLAGCPEGALTAPLTWDARQPGTQSRWSFAATNCFDRGRPVGVAVHVVRDGGSAVSALRSAVQGLRGPVGRSPAHQTASQTFDTLLGQADSFRKAIFVARSAGSTHPVLVEGETGTGKELVAQAIHAASTRAAGPFVAVNCGAVPRDLAVTEFFGFEGGSFTGAAQEGRIGKFEQAAKGTLFLDEIGDMPLELQTLLLRALDQGEVVRVGGRRAIPVDVRVIAATNHDLLVAVEQGTFRRDLYYRLNVIKIDMPPLRERRDDIELLFQLFFTRACSSAGRKAARIAADAVRVLHTYSWPGNIRELRNVAERLAMAGGDQVREQDLPAELLRAHGRLQDSEGGHVTTLKGHEMVRIRSALEQCQGNVTQAARLLGIDRSTIYRKLGRS